MNFKHALVKLGHLFQCSAARCSRRYLSNSCVQTIISPYIVPLDELSTRRTKLIHQFEHYLSRLNSPKSQHIVIIPASEIQYMSYHVPYPFHQDSSFYYLTGLNEPNGILVLLLNYDHELTNPVSCYSYHLFVELRTGKAIQWDGPTLGLTNASSLTGIAMVYSRQDFKRFLEDQFPSQSSSPSSSSSSTYPTYLWYTGLLTNQNSNQRPLNRSVLTDLFKLQRDVQSKLGGIQSPDLLIDQIRLIKSPFEINLLRHAAQITANALKSTMAMAYPGIRESELHNQFEYEVRRRGALLGYPPVIGGGQRATIIHYLNNNNFVRDGELVLMDVGSRVGGYTADMTRTWPVNGVFTPIQRILYEILIEVQQACVRHASPQTSLTDLYELMLKEMLRHLVNEKIIPDDSTIAAIRQICPHHVGHYLGLDVHDTPTIPNSRKLEPGFVFPLEPGFYFRPELKSSIIGLRNELVNVGLRLEDDYVMLDNGTLSCLTSTMPSQVSDLESLIGSGSSQIAQPDVETLRTC